MCREAGEVPNGGEEVLVARPRLLVRGQFPAWRPTRSVSRGQRREAKTRQYAGAGNVFRRVFVVILYVMYARTWLVVVVADSIYEGILKDCNC